MTEYSKTSQILAARIQLKLNDMEGKPTKDWIVELASERAYPTDEWSLEEYRATRAERERAERIRKLEDRAVAIWIASLFFGGGIGLVGMFLGSTVILAIGAGVCILSYIGIGLFALVQWLASRRRKV